MPTLLQLPKPGLDTVQSSTIVGVYGLASVLGGVVLGAILAKVSRFLVIGIALGLAAVMSVVVYLLPDPGFGSLLVVLGITGFILPTAFGPTRSVLAAMAYPASMRGAGIGVAEFGGRLGAAAGGVAGGTLIAGGMGLSGIFPGAAVAHWPASWFVERASCAVTADPAAGAIGSRSNWPGTSGRNPRARGRHGLMAQGSRRSPCAREPAPHRARSTTGLNQEQQGPFTGGIHRHPVKGPFVGCLHRKNRRRPGARTQAICGRRRSAPSAVSDFRLCPSVATSDPFRRQCWPGGPHRPTRRQRIARVGTGSASNTKKPLGRPNQSGSVFPGASCAAAMRQGPWLRR